MKIPVKELDFSFSRSSGPGGQNVNKVNTKATLKWNIKKSKALKFSVVERFLKQYSGRILENGTVVISSDRFRSQTRNIADCVEKLMAMIEKVKTPPKKRKATKPTKASIEKRLRLKKNRSKVKKLRSKKEMT